MLIYSKERAAFIYPAVLLGQCHYLNTCCPLSLQCQSEWQKAECNASVRQEHVSLMETVGIVGTQLTCCYKKSKECFENGMTHCGSRKPTERHQCTRRPLDKPFVSASRHLPFFFFKKKQILVDDFRLITAYF